MRNIAYYNGTFGAIDELQVPLTDRGLYFGDGVYDATACRNNKPFALDEHLDRFYSSLSELGIAAPMPPYKLSLLLREMCARVETGGTHICYWQVTRGAAHPRPAPTRQLTPCLMAYVEPMALNAHSRPLHLMTIPDTRYEHCNIKTLNLLPNVMASQRAHAAGCDEVVFHRTGVVTECAHSNIAMIKDGVFITPPLSRHILEGITRRHCLQLCEALGIPTVQRQMLVSELFDADEVLVLSSGCMGVSACELDERVIGGKAPTLLHGLQQAYAEKFLSDTE